MKSFFEKFIITSCLALMMVLFPQSVLAQERRPPYKAEPFPNYVCYSAHKDQTTVVPECTVGGVFDPTNKADVACACCGDCQINGFVRLAVEGSRLILGLIGTIALAFFVYGGMLLIVSGGNTTLVDKGKKTLTGAVIGVIIVVGAYYIVDLTVATFTKYKGIDDIQSKNNAGVYLNPKKEQPKPGQTK